MNIYKLIQVPYSALILNYSNIQTYEIFPKLNYLIFSLSKKFKKNFNYFHDSRYPIPTNESISRKKLSFWLPWWPLCPQTFRTVPPMFCQTWYVDRRWSVLTKSPSQCKNKSSSPVAHKWIVLAQMAAFVTRKRAR